MKKKQLTALVAGAMIAALYAAATYASAVFGIAHGPLQFRLSEALTVLSVLTPAAVPGLTIGCILGNLSSPYGIWDIIFGSVATLLSALCARKLRKITFKGLPLPSIFMPVILNSLIIGAETALLMPAQNSAASVFIVSALEIGASELAACLAGGIPLYYALKKSRLFDGRQN